MKPNLKTPRLLLRPYQPSDYPAWVEYWTSMKAPRNAWDLARRTKEELSKAQFLKIIKDQMALRSQDKFYNLAAFRINDGKIVGGVALMDVSRGVFQNAYLGYSVSNLYWGLGYGKEAVKACLEIGFKQLRLHRIEAGISPHNKRSIALAKSLKMRKEGRKVRALYLNQKWQDIMVYALTGEELGIKYRSKDVGQHQSRR